MQIARPCAGVEIEIAHGNYSTISASCHPCGCSAWHQTRRGPMEGDETAADAGIASFCAITGAPEETAKYYLGAAGSGALEAALSLFFDDAGGASSSSHPPPVAPEAVRAPIKPQRSVLVDGDGDDDDYGAGGMRATPTTLDYSNFPLLPLRAAAATRDAEGRVGSSYAGAAAPASVVEPFRDFSAEAGSALRRGRSGALGRPAAASPENGDDDAATRQGTQRRLAALFRPPTEIMFRGAFEDARRHGRTAARYILITLHDSSEFSCQAMIRDVWNDSAIQEYIREALVFLFLTLSTAEADRYCQYYPFDGALPHWALIDPRTGKRVRTGGGRVIGAPEMLQELVEYVSDHPLAPPHQQAAAAEHQSAAKRASPTPIEALLRGSSDGAGASQSLPEGKGAESLCSTAEADSGTTKEAEPWMVVGNGAIAEEPPASHEGAVTIQLRMPSGERVRRRFDASQPISHIFFFVAGHLKGLAASEEDTVPLAPFDVGLRCKCTQSCPPHTHPAISRSSRWQPHSGPQSMTRSRRTT